MSIGLIIGLLSKTLNKIKDRSFSKSGLYQAGGNILFYILAFPFVSVRAVDA